MTKIEQKPGKLKLALKSLLFAVIVTAVVMTLWILATPKVMDMDGHIHLVAGFPGVLPFTMALLGVAIWGVKMQSQGEFAMNVRLFSSQIQLHIVVRPHSHRIDFVDVLIQQADQFVGRGEVDQQ